MDIFDVLEKYGVTTKRDFTRARLKADFNQFVNTWKNYYDGNVPEINTTTGYNGHSFFPIKRQSMKLAKQIAIKWATLLFTEQFQVTLKNDTETDKFRELEKQIGFRSKITQAAIYAYGMGTAALLASADILTDKETQAVRGGKLKLDMIKYDGIYPLEFDQNDIQSIAFVTQRQGKNETIYTIGIHTKDGDKIKVENIIATVKGDDVSFSPAETVKQDQEFNNQQYCIIKPNTINDYTDVLPFGASIFADAFAPCQDIDLAADLLRRDVREGAQVTFIGQDLLFENVQTDEQKKKLFDNSPDRFFVINQALRQQGTETKQLYDRVVPEIRTAQCWQVVKDSLNWATLASGLGKGSLDIIPQQTATAVITTEAEKMQSKSLHEQYLESELIKLVKALCELSGMIGNPIDASEVTIIFEDSVIVDTVEQKRLALAEIDGGVLAAHEYRQRFYGETQTDAMEKINAIKGENKIDYTLGNDFNFEE